MSQGSSTPGKSILPAHWDVPQEFHDRLGERVGRQRAMIAAGHLLLVLHRPPKPNEMERQGRFFWRKPDGSWDSNELGSGQTALEKHLVDFTDRIIELDRQQEAAKLSTEYFSVLEATAPVHRAARNLHATLQHARQECPQIHELINFRDRAYEIERNSELLYEDTKNGLEFAVAKRAEEQADSSHKMALASHRLNQLAAFFFPMVTLASIFGTNLKHTLEESQPPIPFLTVMGLGLFAGIVLNRIINRPTK